MFSFSFSVTLLWDNDTQVFEFTVKGKLPRKRNAFPLKQWQCVLSFASTSLHSSTSFAYTHMTYANYPSFPGFRWKQKYCLLASLRVMSNFEHYTTVVLLCVVLKTGRCFTHKYSTSIRCTFNWLTENWHLRPRDLPGFYFLHEPTLLIRPGH